MNTKRIMAVAMLIAGCGLALNVVRAQPPGIKRTELQRHDLGIPGREVVQVRVELAPGVAFGRHTHPGEEVINVLEGSFEYEIEGRPPARLEAGDVLFIPAGTIHAAKNVGNGNAAELATYIVEKGKPILTEVGDRASDAIRPFRVHVPQEDLTDLRRRISATRWPDKETVTDRSQGVQLARLQALVSYWGAGYDWRKAEAKLNALPMFVTRIDGLDIHFIHVRSRHPNAIPLIITHGWPGSILEQVKIIEPLSDPSAHGGRAEDAFDVVIPSMPGYGFSDKPQGTGWGPDRIARAWDVLMKRLGYTGYVSQGGDWGSVVANAMGRLKPAGLLGIHVNMPPTVPAEVARVLRSGGPAPAELSDREKEAFESLNDLYTRGGAYAGIMVTRPQTLGYSLADSPAGMAAFFYDKFNDWTYSGGDAEKILTRDEMLDDITLYWLTNTGTSSARLYWENNNNNFNAVEQKTADISIPVAVTVFPGEIYRAPETWTRRAYRNLTYFHEVDNGGHFAAWEQPELFAEELRAAFRSLRASAETAAGAAAR